MVEDLLSQLVSHGRSQDLGFGGPRQNQIFKLTED